MVEKERKMKYFTKEWYEMCQNSSWHLNMSVSKNAEEFKKEWSGCTLTEIYYAGDDVSAEYQDWADRQNADEVIVLLSSFNSKHSFA